MSRMLGAWIVGYRCRRIIRMASLQFSTTPTPTSGPRKLPKFSRLLLVISFEVGMGFSKSRLVLDKVLHSKCLPSRRIGYLKATRQRRLRYRKGAGLQIHLSLC